MILRASQIYSRTQSFIFCSRQTSNSSWKGYGRNLWGYTLVALNGCFTTVLLDHAYTNGRKIDEVESTLGGDLDVHGSMGLDENVRKVFEKIMSYSE